MIDADFEKDSRAHSFWQEWQSAADQPTEPETITEHLASVSEDWAVVLSEKPEPKSDCCTDTGRWESLIWADNIKKYA